MLSDQEEAEQNAADTGHDGQIAAYLRGRDVAVTIVDARDGEKGDVGVKQNSRLC